MNRHERRRRKVLTHKSQHYVSQGYLRAWCDPQKLEFEEPYVWLFERDGPTAEKPGKRKSPENIFNEREMYTITSEKDPELRDLSLEHGLDRIESDFCAVRRDFIELRRPLGAKQRTILLTFAASSQFRTPRFREHTREQWRQVLNVGRDLEEKMREASPEQKKRAALASGFRSSDRKNSLTIDQVQQIVDKPLQTVLGSHVNTTVPLLRKMTNLTILCTKKVPGFITSDEPVVWFDPEAYKRPPMYRGAALMYESIEITLPISPTRMLFLGRKNENWPEYMDLDALDLDEMMLNDLNRRTCRYAREKVVVVRDEFRPIWAVNGRPPADEWRAPTDDEGSSV